MTTSDLDRELGRLAEGIEVPVVPVSADVARGQRRLLRHRLTVAGAAVATVAVLGSATFWGPGAPETAPGPVDRTPDAERTTIGPDPSAPATPLPPVDGRSNAEQLAGWNDVLAEHLDPGREHLAPYARSTANEQSSGGTDGLASLGSRFGWTNPGEEGLGMLEVSVARDRQAQWWPCRTGVEADLVCRDTEGPNGEAARVGTSDSITTVQLEQADGEVVALTLDLLFGNNSLVPLSGASVTTDELLEAAADERLDLPTPAPAGTVEPIELVRVAEELLLDEGQELSGFPGTTGTGMDGAVFEGRRQVALVAAEAYPANAGYALPTGCDRREFLACDRFEVEGQEVFVGELEEKFFPGLQVVVAGPEHVVRIQWERSGEAGDEADRDALVAFATDPRWQQ